MILWVVLLLLAAVFMGASVRGRRQRWVLAVSGAVLVVLAAVIAVSIGTGSAAAGRAGDRASVGSEVAGGVLAVGIAYVGLGWLVARTRPWVVAGVWALSLPGYVFAVFWLAIFAATLQCTPNQSDCPL